MSYVYNFCFYFSLRLGAIMIGVFSLLQGITMIISLSLGFGNKENISNQLDVWSKENDLIFATSTFKAIEMDPEKYLVACLTFHLFYTTSCLTMIYGAYVCNTYLLYPYLLNEFLRVIALFALHVVAMMLIKQNVINLGLIIGLTVLGGFILLGLIYMWICVYSLLKLVKDLVKEVETEKISTFPPKPAKPSVYSVF